MCCILTVQGHRLSNKVSALEKSESLLSHRELRPGSGSSVRSSSSSGKKDSPFGGFILGCILIGLALPMVWMNERKQVKIYKLIEKARELAVANAPSGEVISNYNFKLIHTSATTTTEAPIDDQELNLTVEDSIKVKRVVEMYQWNETKQDGEDDQEATYTYTQEWSSFHVDSTNFNSQWYTNPDFPVE